MGLTFIVGAVAYLFTAIVVGRLSDKFVCLLSCICRQKTDALVLLQGPRYLIISGIMISGIGFFFLGPAHFITHPYVQGAGSIY